MAKYKAQAAIARSEEIKHVVEAAMMNTAQNVLHDPNAPDYDMKRRLATVMLNPVSQRDIYIGAMQWRVALNPTVQSAIVEADGSITPANLGDGDVQFIVEGEWLDVARMIP